MAKRNLRQEMKQILDSLGYDFKQFSIPDFIKHLEQLTGKRFHFIPRGLIKLGTFGAWLTSDKDELFFYEKTCIPAHRIHHIMHEIGHMLCGHKTEHVTLEEVLTILNGGTYDLANALKYHHSADVTELEVDMMAAVLRERVISYNRMQALTSINPPDEATKIYLSNVGLL